MSESVPTVMWFRRDLRLSDNPALLDALDRATGVLPLFVLDPALWGPSGAPRKAYLAGSLRALDAAIGGLQVVRGKPERQVVLAAKEVGAKRVHVAADFGPYGRERDERVEEALGEAGIELVRTGSPYAVSPGRIRNGSGSPYKVYTPFSKAWLAHGWRDPVKAPSSPRWLTLEHTVEIPDVTLPTGIELPEAGEDAARKAWRAYAKDDLTRYADERDRPDLDTTSRMSHHLKYGEVHPRTLLADLSGQAKGISTYRGELAWRDFYADVLAQHPDSAREYLRPEYAAMEYDAPGTAFDAWREGRTGFPAVDAAMRQLRAIGWMHNRMRMITASFLVKDLHVEWQHGARHFMAWLVDGDLASNNHGWQWVAGSGTDAAPYFRVFNPTTQGKKFDPQGVYVRRWVPELDDDRVDDPHDPSAEARDAVGYPSPVVDHKAERQAALDRWEAIR